MPSDPLGMDYSQEWGRIDLHDEQRFMDQSPRRVVLEQTIKVFLILLEIFHDQHFSQSAPPQKTCSAT